MDLPEFITTDEPLDDEDGDPLVASVDELHDMMTVGNDLEEEKPDISAEDGSRKRMIQEAAGTDSEPEKK